MHAQWLINIRHWDHYIGQSIPWAAQCLCVGLLQQMRWWWCSGSVMGMLKGSAIAAIFLVGGVQPFTILFGDNLIVPCGSCYLKRQKQERTFSPVTGIPVHPGSFLFPVDMEQSWGNNGAFLHVILPESLRLQFTCKFWAPPALVLSCKLVWETWSECW